jgi:hypothetical protein
MPAKFESNFLGPAMSSTSYQEGNILYNNSDSFSYITKDMKKRRSGCLETSPAPQEA